MLPHGKPFVIASDLDLPAVDARKIVSGTARYLGVSDRRQMMIEVWGLRESGSAGKLTKNV